MDLIWSVLSKVYELFVIICALVESCQHHLCLFVFNFHRKTLSRSTPIKNEAISLGNDLHK